MACDEIWAYVGKKESHKLPMEAHDDSIGDAYCFVAMEPNTKLILNFALGRRSQATTDAFIEGLRQATARQHFQISTDGFQYKSAITTTLSDRCDFAQIIKVYVSGDPEGQRRHSPADVSHTEKIPAMGNPDPKKDLHVSYRAAEPHDPYVQAPSHAADERLQQEVGQPVGGLLPALRLLQLRRIHKTLRVTPAMETGITSRVWTLADLLA